jgi:hypothetical protein
MCLRDPADNRSDAACQLSDRNAGAPINIASMLSQLKRLQSDHLSLRNRFPFHRRNTMRHPIGVWMPRLLSCN